MIVGHFLLAFSLVALYAIYRELGSEYALTMGLIAGGFAVLPDIDILFAARELLVLFSSGVSGFVDSFWQTSKIVHRGWTHSLVTLFISASLFSIYHKTSYRLIAITALPVAFFTGIHYGNVFTAGVMIFFIAGGLLISRIAESKVESRDFTLSVFLGLLLHPFGDVFTGTPPEFFYPFETGLFSSRVIIFGDPVINLLAIFALEFSLVWIGLLTVSKLRGIDVKREIKGFSFIGLVYAPAAIYIQAPTLEVAYQFVFSVIGFGALIAFVAVYLSEEKYSDFKIDDLIGACLNLAVAVTAAFTGYVLIYTLLI